MKVKLIKKLILNNQLNLYLNNKSYNYIIEDNKNLNIDFQKHYEMIISPKNLFKKTCLFYIKFFHFLKFPLIIKFFKNYYDLTYYLENELKKKSFKILLLKKRNFFLISQHFITFQNKHFLHIIDKLQTQIFRLKYLFMLKSFFVKKLKI